MQANRQTDTASQQGHAERGRAQQPESQQVHSSKVEIRYNERSLITWYVLLYYGTKSAMTDSTCLRVSQLLACS